MHEDRIAELRLALSSEEISYSELAEIDALAVEYGVRVTDEMMAGDILDAIEDQSTKITVTMDRMDFLEALDVAYNMNFQPLIDRIKPFGIRFCENCEAFYGEEDGRPYKYETEKWLCDSCHDSEMEGN